MTTEGAATTNGAEGSTATGHDAGAADADGAAAGVGHGDAADAVESKAPPPEESVDYKRFQKLKNLELRVTRGQMALKQQEAEIARRAAEFEEKQRTLEAKLKDLELFEEDPIAWAEKSGRDPLDIINRAADPLSPAEKRMRQLEKELQELKTSKQKEAEEARKRQYEQEYEEHAYGLVTSIDEKEYPYITAAYRTPEQRKKALENLYTSGRDAFLDEYGREPTDAELLLSLENHTASYISSIRELDSKLQSAKGGVAAQSGSQSGGQKTLSNVDASEPSGSSRELSLEERKARLIARLTAADPR